MRALRASASLCSSGLRRLRKTQHLAPARAMVVRVAVRTWTGDKAEGWIYLDHKLRSKGPSKLIPIPAAPSALETTISRVVLSTETFERGRAAGGIQTVRSNH